MRASVALRVGTPGWQDEAAFERLLGAIGAQGPSVGMADELALFTSITHTPVRIERYRELVPVARRRMERARARGLRAGLNILTTIGHHEEDLPRAPQGASPSWYCSRSQTNPLAPHPHPWGWARSRPHAETEPGARLQSPVPPPLRREPAAR